MAIIGNFQMTIIVNFQITIIICFQITIIVSIFDSNSFFSRGAFGDNLVAVGGQKVSGELRVMAIMIHIAIRINS